MPELARLLRDGGRLLILYMAWLPEEDRIAGMSEKMILKYNPVWSGCGEKRRPIWIPDVAFEYFEPEEHEEYDLKVPFTRESWHGRIRASRGVGASLDPDALAAWDAEHWKMLMENAPEKFDVLHYGALAVLRKK